MILSPLAALHQEDLPRVVAYVNTRSQERTGVLWQQLVHVVNHGTQHHSEAATPLTALGHSPGDLDMIFFFPYSAVSTEPGRSALSAPSAIKQKASLEADRTKDRRARCVGQPYQVAAQSGHVRNPPWAKYALLTASGYGLNIDFRRVGVDERAVVNALRASGVPHAEWLAQDWG